MGKYILGNLRFGNFKLWAWRGSWRMKWNGFATTCKAIWPTGPQAIPAKKSCDCAFRAALQVNIRNAHYPLSATLLSLSDMEERAIALQAHSDALLADAIEKLKAADERINFLESERKAAKTHIRETELKVEDLQSTVEDLQSAVDEADSRMKAAGQRLWQAERSARASATRAEEAEKALVQVEEAIRTQLIGKRAAPSKRVAAA